MLLDSAVLVYVGNKQTQSHHHETLVHDLLQTLHVEDCF